MPVSDHVYPSWLSILAAIQAANIQPDIAKTQLAELLK
jgi:hypothetical protein